MGYRRDPEGRAAESAPAPRERRSRRIILKGMLALLAIIPVVAGTYVFDLAQTYDSNIVTIEPAFPAETVRPQRPVPVKSTSPMNILVMGSDSRGATELDVVNGAATDQRADTLMLMHIPADRKNVYTISLMRDLWVQIPGHGEAKINAALAFGGVPLMVQTVESIFNQRIDHVAIVDFEGFKGLTDALGGVDVHVAVPFTSAHGGHTFTAGVNRLNGQQALAFVRERYAFADGDYQRVRNQQSFLEGVMAKTIDAKTLANPVTVHSMVSAVSPFISVDKGLDAATLAGLGLELKDIRQEDMVMFTLPTRGTGTSTDGQSIVLTDPAAINQITAALAEDKLGDYVAANSFEKGN